MSSYKENQKGKNRYSKSQQIDNIGFINQPSINRETSGRQSENNLIKHNTQTEYENILKTQEGNLETEINENVSAHAILFPLNNNNKNYNENKDEDDVFDILKNQIFNKKGQQGSQVLSLGLQEKTDKTSDYQMQIQGDQDKIKASLLSGNTITDTIQYQQSIKIPIQSISENKGIYEGINLQTKESNDNTKGITSPFSTKQLQRTNDSQYVDKIRRIQNMKNKKIENNKQLRKVNSIGLSSNSQPTNIDEFKCNEQELMDLKRQSLLGTVILKGNQAKSIFNQETDQKKIQIAKNWRVIDNLGIALRLKQRLFRVIQQRIEYLTQFQHYLIGDCTDAPNIKQKESSNQINSFFQKTFISVLNPNSPIVVWYKKFLVLITLFMCIYLPLIFGFDLEFSTEAININTICVVVFSYEVFNRFRISYYHLGEIVTDRRQIAIRYIKNEFITDIISILGVLLGFQYKPLLFFILLRTRNISQYLWDIDNHYYLAERFHAFWILIKLFGFIAIMAHYFACVFHYCGMVQEDDPDVATTWTKEFSLTDKPWTLRYNYSLYFSFITCITIGYGDITPKNTLERNIVIIISLVSTGCFSYSVNTMATIFQEYINQQKISKEMRYDAISYMRERSIHKNLQLRVLRYIEYRYQIENKSPDKGLNAINQISEHLKAQIFQDFYGKLLKQNKYISLHYSNETINKLSLKMKERIYAPGEIIFEQKELDTRLFYLMKGEIEFCIQTKGNKISEVQSISKSDKNMFFGYKGLISDIPREMTCKSVNVTQVFYCDREDLVSILKENPEEYERFCKLRDEYLNLSHTLGEQCYSCSEYGHTISHCHKIRLTLNKEMLILKSNYSRDQQRLEYFRKKIKRYSPIINQELTSFEAMKCKLTNIIKLRKQNITDEQIENIIIEENVTNKKFALKYPSVTQHFYFPFIIILSILFYFKIKFTEKEMYVCQIDDQEEYSCTDSDSLLSQSGSEQSDSISSISLKNNSFLKKDKIPEQEQVEEYEPRKRSKKQKEKTQQYKKISIKNKDFKPKKIKNKFSYDVKNEFDDEIYQEQQMKIALNQQNEKKSEISPNQDQRQYPVNQNQSLLNSQNLTIVPEYNTEQVQSNQIYLNIDSQIKEEQSYQSETQNKKSIHSRNHKSLSISGQCNDDQRKVMGLIGFADDNQDYLFDSESEQKNQQNDNNTGQTEPNKVQHLNQLIQNSKDESKARFSLPIKLSQQVQNKLKQTQNKLKQTQNKTLFSSYNTNELNNFRFSKRIKDLSIQNDQLLSPKSFRKSMASNENSPKQAVKTPYIAQLVSQFSNKSDKLLFASKSSENSQTPQAQVVIQALTGSGKQTNKFLGQQSNAERDMLINFYQTQMGRFGQYITSLMNQNQNQTPAQNSLKYQGFDPYQNVKQFYQKQENPMYGVPIGIANQRRQHADFNEYLKKQIVEEDKDNFGDEEELFFYDFDSIKEFSKYFPHNNASVVCYNYKTHMKKTRKKQPQKFVLSHQKIDLLNNSNDINKIQEIDMS